MQPDREVSSYSCFELGTYHTVEGCCRLPASMKECCVYATVEGAWQYAVA